MKYLNNMRKFKMNLVIPILTIFIIKLSIVINTLSKVIHILIYNMHYKIIDYLIKEITSNSICIINIVQYSVISKLFCMIG